ncbi:FCD domain-containing protein, partial [Bradyrhizobium yuanmingense]
GSRRMLAAHSDLYDQAYRYRRVMMGAIDSGERFIRSHQMLADHVLARDVAAAQKMLAAHLHSTIDFVYPQVGREQS